MSRTREIFEHGTLHVRDTSDGISESEFDALVRFNDKHQRRYFEVGHRRITFKSFVGYIEVGDLSVEILPKADRDSTSSKKVWRDGLLEMLRVALGMRLEQPTTAAQQLARFRLLDLIAIGFLSELEPLLRQGLAKGYRTTESNGAVFRGRLKMADHLRDNVARGDRFFVEYETYDHDIAVNRLLAAALDTLEWCALSPHVATAVEACAARFPAVPFAGVTSALFDRVRLTRSTQRYAGALLYARMILAHQGPQLQAGRERVFALLFDMNLLWERYVAALLRRALVPGIVVSTQERHAFWTAPRHPVRRVRPDIVVRSATGQTLLVIDTKWKVPSKGLPSDDDLKQMFVYNELLAGSRSMLLYPATPSSLPVRGVYAAKAHGCEQVHLGLVDGQSWSTPSIQRQLVAMIETCIHSTDDRRA